MGPWTSLPALLTRTSMPPSAATAAADEGPGVLLQGHVRPARDHAPGRIPELRDERLQALQAPAGGHDVGAPPREEADGVRTQPAGRAGDDDAAALEAHARPAATSSARLRPARRMRSSWSSNQMLW